MANYEVAKVLAGAVHVYEDTFDNGQEIIEILESQGAWDDALVGPGGGEVNKSIRHNKVASIDPFNFRTELVLYNFVRTAWNYINDYAIHYDALFSSIEPVVVNRYEPGDRYLAHADAGPGVPRIISAVAYLNDVDEGGETEFTLFDVSVKPKAGRLIIFPSNYAYRHAALPPISGVKYAAALWTRQ